MQLCLQKFLIKFRFSGNKNQNSWNYSACFLTCSLYFRRLLELWEESPAPALPTDTCSSGYRPSSSFVPLFSELTLWFCTSSTDYCISTDMHVIMGAQALSKRGVFLFGAHVLRNIDLPHTAPEPIPSCCHLPKEMDITFTLKH